MREFEIVIDRINALKAENDGYFTNSYMTLQQLEACLSSQEAHIWQTRRAMGIGVWDRDVRRLYVFAASVQDAATLRSMLAGEQDAVLELIELNPDGPAVRAFVRHGWHIYSRMIQMNRMPTESSLILAGLGEPAAPEDSQDIHALLYKTFDPKISHLPDLHQLLGHIQRGEARLIREDGKIAALSIFTRSGSKAKYLYQLATASEYRGQGYARALLEAEFAQCNPATQYALWVEQRNDAAISLYRALGFQQARRYLTILTAAPGGASDF